MHKINYTIVKKNKYPNAPWYVRKGGLHTFRHSVSTILYRQSGCDIQLVSKMLGHSPQIAMAYYVHGQSVDDMRKLVDP